LASPPQLRDAAQPLLDGDGDENAIYDNCAELTPGLTDTTTASTQIAGRAMFFDCVQGSVYEELEDYTKEPEETKAPDAS
jgi:hypothetical protein